MIPFAEVLAYFIPIILGEYRQLASPTPSRLSSLSSGHIVAVPMAALQTRHILQHMRNPFGEHDSTIYTHTHVRERAHTHTHLVLVLILILVNTAIRSRVLNEEVTTTRDRSADDVLDCPLGESSESRLHTPTGNDHWLLDAKLLWRTDAAGNLAWTCNIDHT